MSRFREGWTKVISICIVDDHLLAREGLTTLLGYQSDFRVVGAVANSDELGLLMAKDPPDVILMDIKLGHENGLKLTARLQRMYPDVHVIILSNFDEDPLVIEAISVGAAGYLLKDCSSALLTHTIYAVTAGAMLFKKELLMRAFERLAPIDAGESLSAQLLTEDERAVLSYIAAGEGNRETGMLLHLSEATVKKRVQSILSKLGVSNRTEAVALATRTRTISALPHRISTKL